MSKSPLYEVIYRKYEEDIKSGRILPGTKLPTEMEIAGDFNVSRITVTRALKELETRRFIHRIKGSGSYVNSTGEWQTETAPPPESSGMAIISLVLPFEGSFSSDFLKGIEDAAKGHNYYVTFHNSSDNPDTEKQIIEDLITRGSSGIVVYPVSTTENLDLYSRLLIRRFPLVLIDRTIPGLDTSLVWTDNRKGFYDITGHLLKLGHTKIIFVGSAVNSISSEYQRYRGFCQAHLDHRLPLMKMHLYSEEDCREIPGDYRPEEPQDNREIHYLLDYLENLEEPVRPTAIAAVNDLIAELIISTALKRGISIPGDYSVTGFDNLPFAAHLPVPLTTVAQPVYEIGRMATEELFRKIQTPGRKGTVRTIASHLIIRESTAAPGICRSTEGTSVYD